MMSLTIGQLAKKANVKLSTIRYYERCGLIDKPKRALSGYRLYSDDFIMRIHFITKAKQLGFTLEEVSELLYLQSNPRIRCAAVKTCTVNKIRVIQDKIELLQKMKTALIQLQEQCSCEGSTGDCRILKSLVDK